MGMVRGNRRKILNGIFSFESGFIFKDGVGLRVSEQTVSFSPLQGGVPCEAGRTKGGKILFQLDPSGIYKYNIHKINNSMPLRPIYTLQNFLSPKTLLFLFSFVRSFFNYILYKF